MVSVSIGSRSDIGSDACSGYEAHWCKMVEASACNRALPSVPKVADVAANDRPGFIQPCAMSYRSDGAS